MTAVYAAGPCATLVADGLVLMAEAAALERVVALSGHADGATVLGVVEELSGGNLETLPPFACVIAGDDLRILVRGDFAVRIGKREWQGVDVVTWTEAREPRVKRPTITVRSQLAGDADLELPLVGGVVLASALSWKPAEVAPEPQPEPEEEQQPKPASIPEPEPVLAPEQVLEPEPELEREPEPEPEAEPEPEDPNATQIEVDEFSAAFGVTVAGRRISDAAVVPAPPSPEASPGDHDGRTVTAAEARALRKSQPPVESGVQITGTVRLTSGQSASLDRPVVIGRRPEARELSTAELPHLVTVDDPYVSSTHVEIAVVDGKVVATDRSTNGTLRQRSGSAPVTLEKGVASELQSGDELVISDALRATVTVVRGE